MYMKNIYNKLNQTNIYYKKYVSNGRKIHEYLLPNRVIYPEEMKMIIQSNGFTIVDEYGDYNFEKLKGESRKQILLVRRSKK